MNTNKNRTYRLVAIGVGIVGFLISFFYANELAQIPSINLHIHYGLSFLFTLFGILTFVSPIIQRNIQLVIGSLIFFTTFNTSLFAFNTNFEPTIAYINLSLLLLGGAFFTNKKTLLFYFSVQPLLLIALLFVKQQSHLNIYNYSILTLLLCFGFYHIFRLSLKSTTVKPSQQGDFLNTIFNNSTEGYILYDTQQKSIEKCNDKTLQLLQISSLNLLQQTPIQNIDLFNFINNQLIIIKSSLRQNQTWTHKKRFNNFKKQTIWLDLTINEVNEASHLLLIRITDTTNERTNKGLFRTMRFAIEQATDMIFWINKDGTIIYANHAAYSILQYKDLVQFSWDNIDIQWQERHDKNEDFWKKLTTKKSITEETTYLRKNNNTIPIEQTHHLIDIEGVEINCIFARNITQQKAAIQKIKQSEERFKAIFDHSPLGLLLLNLNYEVEQCNPYFAKILGYTQEELIGMNANQFVHPDDRGDDKSIVKKYNKSRNSSIHRSKKRYIKKDGSVIWVHLTSTLIHDYHVNKTYGFGMVEDISEYIKVENELKRYSEKLEQSNKALQEFAYAASHDLQEPLRMVTSYLQLIENRYKDQLDQSAKEFISFAVDGAKRMSMLIQSLLYYSRVNTQANPFQTTDCNKIVNTVLTDLSHSIKEHHADIKIKELPNITADNIQMQQLFQNLIGNAIKYNKAAVPTVEINAQENGDYWNFSVIDNGIGIETQYIDKVFGVFKRLHTRHEYEGTGIGLAICQRIVERHGGKIWAESAVGQGTTFYFTIKKEL